MPSWPPPVEVESGCRGAAKEGSLRQVRGDELHEAQQPHYQLKHDAGLAVLLLLLRDVAPAAVVVQVGNWGDGGRGGMGQRQREVY